MRAWILSMVVALVAGSPLTASAQSGPPARDETVEGTPLDRHDGFMIGLSLGWGTAHTSACEGCDGANGLGLDSSIGWFLNPRVALMFDVFAVTTADGYTVESTANAMQSLAVQYWLTDVFWVKGGLGYAKLLTATPFGTTDVGGGGMTLAAGYGLLHGRGNFALDVQARASHADLEGNGLTNFAVLVGVNWY